jgi:hypothetical protein
MGPPTLRARLNRSERQGAQSLWSGRHIPDGQIVLTVSLQLPLPSQAGVTSTPLPVGQTGTPQTVPCA